MDTHVDRRLHRGRRDRVLFGVCSGLGEYFAIDPVLFRLGFVLITLAGGAGLLAYVILAIVLPDEETQPEAGRSGLRQNLASLRENANELVGDVQAGFSGGAPTSAGQATGPADARRGRQLAGLLLVGLGVLFFAGNLGWLAWWHWHMFWPVVLIVLGAAILLRRDR